VTDLPVNVALLIDHGDPNEDAVWVNFHRGSWNSRAGCKNGRDLPGCVQRVRGCLKKIVATGILLFDFELFIGVHLAPLFGYFFATRHAELAGRLLKLR